MRTTLLIITALLLPATRVLAAEGVPAKVNFQEHVLPIFKNACLNCHNADRKKAGLDISTHAGAITGSDGQKVIVPGDAEASILYKTVTHEAEPKMPQRGDKLAAKDLAIIKAWIDGGALETADGKPLAMKPKVDLSVVAPVGKPSEPVVLPQSLPLEPVVKAKRPGPLTALAANPWAPVVAIAGQKSVLLYHTETLDLMGVLPFAEGQVNVLKFSRSGKVVLAAGGQGAKSGRVVLFEIATGKRIAELGEEFDAVLSADLSPDQTMVAVGTPSRMLRLYNTADGSVATSIKKHTDWVTAVAFSPDGQWIASGDRAGNLYIWESSGREIHNLAGSHKAGITGIAFRGDSKVVASSSEDGTVKMWNVGEGTSMKSINAHAGGVASVEFTHDGRMVTTGRDKTARTWKPDGNADKAYEAFPDIALRGVFAHDGGRVVAGDWSGAIRVFGADGKAVGELSSNPPTPAERLALAQQKVAELTKTSEAATAALAGAQGAADQANGAVASAQKALDGAKAALEQAKQQRNAAAGEVSSARSALKEPSKAAELKAELKKAEGEVEAAKGRRAEQVAKLDHLKAAFTTAQKDADAANKSHTDAKAALEKSPDDAALKEKVKEAEATAKAKAEALASAKAAVDDQSARVGRRETSLKQAEEAARKASEALASVEKSTTDTASAVTAAEQKAKAAQDAIAKATADIEAAQKQLTAAQLAAKSANEKLAGAKAAADKAAADLAGAKGMMERITAGAPKASR